MVKKFVLELNTNKYSIGNECSQNVYSLTCCNDIRIDILLYTFFFNGMSSVTYYSNYFGIPGAHTSQLLHLQGHPPAVDVVEFELSRDATRPLSHTNIDWITSFPICACDVGVHPIRSSS